MNGTSAETSLDPNVRRDYYADGSLKIELRVDEENRRHGLAKRYYPSGAVQSEIQYEHGIKVHARQYYKNGQPEMEFNYQAGVKHGPRTKYWDNGQVSSILEYHMDKPGPIEEFNRSGKKITWYPRLIVRQVDKLDSQGEYWVEAEFSSHPSRGTYYIGELENGFLPQGLLKMEKVNKKGRFVFKPLPGTFTMRKMNIIGSYKTQFGNRYLVEESINVAFDY